MTWLKALYSINKSRRIFLKKFSWFEYELGGGNSEVPIIVDSQIGWKLVKVYPKNVFTLFEFILGSTYVKKSPYFER